MRSQPFWAGLEGVAHTLAYDGAILGSTTSGQPLPKARWSAITAPTLVIDGGAADAFIRTAADALAVNLEHAERRTLADQTQDYAAALMAPVLAEFFAASSATRSDAAA
jgi:hypothetical protein